VVSLLKVSESVLFSVESSVLVVGPTRDLCVALGPRREDACCSTSAHSVKGKPAFGRARAEGWAWQGIEWRWWQRDRRVYDVCGCRFVRLGDDVVQVVQDRLLQSGVSLHRGDQDGEVALKLVYQVGNCSVVLGEVSFSGDNDLEVVGDKDAELVEGTERGLNVGG
jgi:hypothetical protein